MTIRNLGHFFRPRSVALIGASNRPHAVGTVLAENLTHGGFDGPVFPVNPHRSAIGGVLAYPSVAALPQTPDLAVIATPPDTIAETIGELAARGTRAIVVISAGFNARDPGGPAQVQAILERARPTTTRIIGPNCLGIAVPGIGLNATFAHLAPRRGDVALVTQSGAIATALIDWAAARDIGFSHVVSLGDMRDVDFGDMLDYLANDASVTSIVLYVEAVTQATKFMSAARAAARLKPVVVLKSGRFAASAAAAASHTGALAGSDAVYDAALRRAGCMRVDELEDLFSVIEALARAHPLPTIDPVPAGRDRVAILTNGGGLGVMATDALIARGGNLAELAPATLDALSEVLPGTWSRANPIDVIGDADGQRYASALEVLLSDSAIDAVVVMNCPTAVASAMEAAEAVARVITAQDSTRNPHPPVFAAWVGGFAAAPARAVLMEAGLPTYGTPEQAVRGVLRRFDYAQAKAQLMRVPPAVPPIPGTVDVPDTKAALRIIDPVIAAGGGWLDEIDAKALLAAYGIPVARGGRVDSVGGVAATAAELLRDCDRIAIKILSPDILHKSDVGGVTLDLPTPEAAEAAAAAMVDRVRAIKPDAHIAGFSVQEMVRRPGAHELIVGVTVDATFGPVLLFGQGGVGVEVIDDTALALPPLDMVLAHDLIRGTRVFRQLLGYRHRPRANLDAIAATLVRLASMIAEQTNVVELDVNPLLADENGVVALDARVRVDPAPRVRMALAPYPANLERPVALPDGTSLWLRPIRPEDAPRYVSNYKKLSTNDVRSRFFSVMRELPAAMLARLTQIDYDREMALLVEQPRGGDDPDGIYGVVRLTSDPDGARAEFGIIVRSDWKGRGLGHLLMTAILDYASQRGVGTVEGLVMRDNQAMLDLAADLGFTVVGETDDPFVIRVVRVFG